MSGLKNKDRVRWNLKFAIIRQHGSETRFARLLGISQQQMTHIVVGRNPGNHVRQKIAILLGHDEVWLFQLGGDGIHNEAIYHCGGLTKNVVIRFYRRTISNIYGFWISFKSTFLKNRRVELKTGTVLTVEGFMSAMKSYFNRHE